MALASHWPVRNGYFLIDDFMWLDLAHWRSVAASFVGTQGAHDVYRPIFRLSVYLDALLFGGHAGAWHIENVAIHAANGFLLAVVARAYRLPRSVCAAAGLLFIFAPLGGECVDWISGRTASLCLLFLLLAVWRWTLAMAEGRVPWAAAGWMVMAAMTYESAVVLPAVLVCLVPLVHKRFGVGMRDALWRSLPIVCVLAVFLVLRAIFLGTFVGYTDASTPHLWQNFKYQMGMLRDIYGLSGTASSLWVLGAALIFTTVAPGFFPAGPCLALIGFILTLPYVGAVGSGGRFQYMMQAPLCVLVVLPAMIFADSRFRGLFLAALLVFLVPPFIGPIWREAVRITVVGQKTKAMIAAIHQAVPRHDGWAQVVEDVPDFDGDYPMMGGFFELGVSNSYSGDPRPLVMRSGNVLGNPIVLRDVLRVSTHYWRYDSTAQRLIPIEKEAWLALHPEAKAYLPQ